MIFYVSSGGLSLVVQVLDVLLSFWMVVDNLAYSHVPRFIQCVISISRSTAINEDSR